MVTAQALKCVRMRAFRSAGVLSMKLTVKVRDAGPQYRVVSSAIIAGEGARSAVPTDPCSGALTGLIWRAVCAAREWSRAGSERIRQPYVTAGSSAWVAGRLPLT